MKNQESVKEKIFEFAYNMAFRDATMRSAFPRFDTEKGDDAYRKRKDQVKKAARAHVKNYIEDIIVKGYCSDPTDTIIRLCGEIEHFSFGNAQKLVNMTAKYMFLSAYADEDKKDCFKNCHCPMDGVMMEWVKKNALKYGLADVKWKKPWSRLGLSKEDQEEYEVFQRCIREIALKEGVLPIEVDFLFWDED